MDFKEKVKLERLFILQVIAEGWLKQHNEPSTEEQFNLEDKVGELNGAQIAALHFFLLERYKKMGLDLASIVEKNGEKMETGKLTKYEMTELMEIADEQIIFIATYEERKQKFQK